MPENLLSDLQAERARFGRSMTNDQCVELLNAVARRHPGWGLLSKLGGNNGTIPGLSGPVSIDHLVYQPLMRGIDVLFDAGNGGPSTPVWGDVETGEQFPADRFVSPVGAGEPGPVPTPGPTPTPEPGPSPDLGAAVKLLAEQIRDFDESLMAMSQTLRATQLELAEQKVKLQALLDRGFPDYGGSANGAFGLKLGILLKPQTK